VARGFLGGRGRSSGTPWDKSYGSMEAGTGTRDGTGTSSGKAMYRSTVRPKSSTDDSGSGSKTMKASSSTKFVIRMLASIEGQSMDLRRDGQDPRYLLIHPRTYAEFLSDRAVSDAVLVRWDTTKVFLFGLEIHPVDWVPDGVAIVASEYTDVEDYKTYYHHSATSVEDDWYASHWYASPWKVPAASTSWSTTTTINPFAMAAGSGATYQIEQTVEPAVEPAVADRSEPDPGSIYGKALKRAREST
jgi:hypothetical protein